MYLTGFILAFGALVWGLPSALLHFWVGLSRMEAALIGATFSAVALGLWEIREARNQASAREGAAIRRTRKPARRM